MEELAVYRVKAQNTSADSENKIHDDSVAARFGFRGGLVPGVTIYGYMTVPLVEEFALDWLACGTMQVKFLQPCYEGDSVYIRTQVDRQISPIQATVTAEREDETVCAVATATVNDPEARIGDFVVENFSESPLPQLPERPMATRSAFPSGAVVGTLNEDVNFAELTWLTDLQERLTIYRGQSAVAHPAYLLGLANQVLVKNYELGPWIHVASEIINHGVVRDGEKLRIQGRVRDCFERKGHEFVVLDLLYIAAGSRRIQEVRHTAIYRPRFV